MGPNGLLILIRTCAGQEDDKAGGDAAKEVKKRGRRSRAKLPEPAEGH